MTQWREVLLLGGLLIGMVACAHPGRVTPYDLGVEAQDRGEIAPALEYYKEMLMEHPEHLRARFNLAVLYHDQQRYAEAKYHYQTLLDRYPKHARSMVNLADIALAQGRPTQAHLHLLHAVETEPDRAYPYSFLGRFLQRQGQREQAQQAYERALAIEDDAVTHYRFGLFWLETNHLPKAKAQLIQAIKRDPHHAEALYELAKLAQAMKDPAEAVKYLQRLAQLTPARAAIFVYLGELYLQLGDYAAAALNLWEARDRQPNTPEVERLLLRVYQQLLLQQQAAVQHLEKDVQTSR